MENGETGDVSAFDAVAVGHQNPAGEYKLGSESGSKKRRLRRNSQHHEPMPNLD